MNLTKWTTGLKPKFPKFIESLFGKRITDDASEDQSVSTTPSVNVTSADKTYDIKFAVPGLDKKDIKIHIEGNILTVSSEKQYSKEDRGKNYIRQEFGYAAFSRSFAIPDGIKEENIEAKLDKGILTIEIPYTQETQSNVRLISIK